MQGKLVSILVLLSCWSDIAVRGEVTTLTILATYNGSESAAGSFTYDSATPLGSPFGQEYFPLTAFSFTSPASGSAWTLVQAWRSNGPPGYGLGPSNHPFVTDNVLAEVLLNGDGTASGVGVVPFGHLNPSRWVELSPFVDNGIPRMWREYNGSQLRASGTYRIVPEPTSPSLLLSFAVWLACGHRNKRYK